MALHGPAKRLTIYVGESDRFEHHPLSTEIVHRAHRAGMAGASVFRGIEGFGASRHVHTTRLLSLSEDLPVAVVIIDESAAVERFADEVQGLIGEGLIVIDDVVVRHHAARRSDQGRPG